MATTRWVGRRVIPESWVDASVTSCADARDLGALVSMILAARPGE